MEDLYFFLEKMVFNITIFAVKGDSPV